MSVGILRVHLRLYGCQTLKEKRSVVKGILAKVRREFNVSAAELDHLDNPEAAVLGFAHLTTNGRHSDQVLMSLVRRLEGSPKYALEDFQIQVL